MFINFSFRQIFSEFFNGESPSCKVHEYWDPVGRARHHGAAPHERSKRQALMSSSSVLTRSQNLTLTSSLAQLAISCVSENQF